jgi:hypothetical protein
VNEEPKRLLTRLGRAWRALTSDGKLAAISALLLFVTMFLPWYQQNAVVTGGRGAPLVSRNLSAFGVFSFVEAAVLLVAVAVLFLLFSRAEGRRFHLPGGDGTIVMVAGGWVALLLVWRLFDKPGITTQGVAANVGVQWGIFFALGAAGLLTYSGVRMRQAHRPEPEGPVESSPEERAARRRRPRPAPGTEATRPLPAESPRWEDAPTERAPFPPADPPTRPLPPDPPDPQDPPTQQLRPRDRDRERDRPAPQSERLWDDHR